MNLPSILFKYPREVVKATRNEYSTLRKWIPMGSLISGILFESKLVQKLMEVGMTKEVDFSNWEKFQWM